MVRCGRQRVGRRAAVWVSALAVVAAGCTGTGEPTDPEDGATTAAQGPPPNIEASPAEVATEEVRDDGVVWERLAVDNPLFSRPERDEVLDLIPGDQVLVAGGRRDGEAAAWLSEDGGDTWTVGKDLPQATTGSVDIGVVLGDGAIALAGAEVEGDSIASAWRSDGGPQFTPAPFGGDIPAGYPFGMAETPSGLVLLDNAIRVWRSKDGARWTPVTGPEGDPLLLAPLHIPTGPIVREDGSLLAVAIREQAELLTSDDDGRTWSSRAIRGNGLDGVHLRRLIELPDGTLLAGGLAVREDDDVEDAVLARSEDGGRTWEPVDLSGVDAATGPGRQAITGLVAVGDAVVAVGAASAGGDRWPGAWLSEDGGVTWEDISPGREIAPRGREDAGRGQGFEDAAVVDGDIVVVGHQDSGADRDVTVWRLRLPA